MKKDREFYPILEVMERITNLAGSEERAQGEVPAFRDVHLRSLRYLARCNRYSNTPTALREFLGITKGTVSQSIRILEERGLVEKSEDGEDGRITRLKLTGEGRAFVRRNNARGSLEDLLANSLNQKERGTLRALLLKSLRTIQEKTQGRMFGVCASCRHFRRNGMGSRHQCGLTGEPLSEIESAQICREHELAE